MKWNDFAESKKESPEKALEQFIIGFSQATKELASLYISPISEAAKTLSKLDNFFQFYLILYSQYVEGYRFKVLQLGYDVELLQINIILEDTIYEELYAAKQKYGSHIILKNDDEFVQFIEKIFSTKRFTDIVSGLMKIAKKTKQ